MIFILLACLVITWLILVELIRFAKCWGEWGRALLLLALLAGNTWLLWLTVQRILPAG